MHFPSDQGEWTFHPRRGNNAQMTWTMKNLRLICSTVACARSAHINPLIKDESQWCHNCRTRASGHKKCDTPIYCFFILPMEDFFDNSFFQNVAHVTCKSTILDDDTCALWNAMIPTISAQDIAPNARDTQKSLTNLLVMRTKLMHLAHLAWQSNQSNISTQLQCHEELPKLGSNLTEDLPNETLPMPKSDFTEELPYPPCPSSLEIEEDLPISQFEQLPLQVKVKKDKKDKHKKDKKDKKHKRHKDFHDNKTEAKRPRYHSPVVDDFSSELFM